MPYKTCKVHDPYKLCQPKGLKAPGLISFTDGSSWLFPTLRALLPW